MADLQTLEKAWPHYESLTVLWGGQVLVTMALIVGGWVGAQWLERAIKSALSKFKGSDPMLVGFFSSLTRWVVVVVTGLAVLDRLGVQTTSILTILGAAGLAVGLAMQGTLTNLAAGIMLLLFRPFRVGDQVETTAITGTISAVSLFHTELITPDHVQVIAPNSLLWGVGLKNTTFYPIRRLSLIVPVPFQSDVDQAITQIRNLIAAEHRVESDPAPEVFINRFNATDKVTEIEVYLWADQSHHQALRTELFAAIWRAVLSQRP